MDLADRHLKHAGSSRTLSGGREAQTASWQLNKRRNYFQKISWKNSPLTASRIVSRSDSGTNPRVKSIPKRVSRALSCHSAQKNTGQVRHLDEFKVTNTETGLNKVHTTRSAETTALRGMHFYGPCQVLLHRSLEVLPSCHRITQDGRDL